jgi:hypothetical protein
MRALNDIYPEYNWPYVPKRVVHKTKPEGFWGSRENAVHFVKYLEAKFNIKTLDDWNYVTLKSVLDNEKVFYSYEKIIIVFRYNGSLRRALLDVYPNYNWELQEIRTVSKTQQALYPFELPSLSLTLIHLA